MGGSRVFGCPVPFIVAPTAHHLLDFSVGEALLAGHARLPIHLDVMLVTLPLFYAKPPSFFYALSTFVKINVSKICVEY